MFHAPTKIGKKLPELSMLNLIIEWTLFLTSYGLSKIMLKRKFRSLMIFFNEYFLNGELRKTSISLWVINSTEISFWLVKVQEKNQTNTLLAFFFWFPILIADESLVSKNASALTAMHSVDDSLFLLIRQAARMRHESSLNP